MTLPLRDVQRHTYGEYQIRKLGLYECHGVREYWLAHPSDRIVIVYRLEGGVYGRPLVHEMQDRLAATACPQVEIDWGRVLKGLPQARDA